MNRLAVHKHPGRDSSSTSDSGSGGGQVEDILERLGHVETDVSDLKLKVGAILATVPHLATKADVMDVRSAVAELRAETSSAIGSLRSDMERGLGSLRAETSSSMGTLRADMERGFGSMRAEMSSAIGSLRADMENGFGSLRAEMSSAIGSLRADMAARENAFMRWMIATVLAAGGLALTIAKFVH
jgi:hypothetical protein